MHIPQFERSKGPAHQAAIGVLLGLDRNSSKCWHLRHQARRASEDEWPLDYLIRAESLFAVGRASDATADIDTAITIAPEAAESYFQKARLHALMGEISQSEIARKRAISLDPTVAGKSLDEPLDFTAEKQISDFCR